MKRVGIPAELHVYAKGEHGFGVRQKGQPTDAWTDACVAWLRGLGMLKPGRGDASPVPGSEGNQRRVWGREEHPGEKAGSAPDESKNEATMKRFRSSRRAGTGL